MSTRPPPPAADDASSEALWTAAWEQARIAWPIVAVSRERFVAYVRERLPPDRALGEALAAAHVGDLYLACGCVDGGADALAAFDQHCMARMARPLGRLGLPPHQVDEVLQVLRHALLVRDGEAAPRLERYTGSGPLVGWLRVTATREATRLMRKGNREIASQTIDLSDRIEVDLETAYLKQHYRREFTEAFTEALQTLSLRDQGILRLQIIEGLSVDQLSAMYRVHRTTLWRWLTEARETLQQRTRQLLARRIVVTDAELDTILRLIDSQLVAMLDHAFDPKPDRKG